MPGRLYRTFLLVAAALALSGAASAQQPAVPPATPPSATTPAPVGMPLAPDDAAHLMKNANAQRAAFQSGDVDALMQWIHPKLIQLAGGEGKLRDVTQSVMQSMKSMGVTVGDYHLEQPTVTYRSGDDIVCFVPEISTITVKGISVHSISFLIAARTAHTEWKFIDGSSLKGMPGLLQLLFPELPKDIPLPPNRQEIVNPPSTPAAPVQS